MIGNLKTALGVVALAVGVTIGAGSAVGQSYARLQASSVGPVACGSTLRAIPGLPKNPSAGSYIFLLEDREIGPGDQWAITFVHDGRSIRVGPSRSRAHFLDRRHFEVAVPDDSGRLEFSCSDKAPRIRPLGFLPVPPFRESLYSLHSPYPPEDNRIAGFKELFGAIGRLSQVKSQTRVDCNAFRVAPGWWLTNLHCFIDKYRINALHTNNTGVFIHAGDSAGTTFSVEATPVAWGNVVLGWHDGTSTADYYAGFSPAKGPDATLTRDFAVLKELGESPSPGPSIPLSEVRPERGGELGLLQWWTAMTRADGAAGLGGELGGQCAFLTAWDGRPTALADCAAPLISHRCGTLPGTSGSPLVDPRSKLAVGLHFLGSGADGLNVNCAVAGADILVVLKESYPDVYRALVRSPGQ